MEVCEFPRFNGFSVDFRSGAWDSRLTLPGCRRADYVLAIERRRDVPLSKNACDRDALRQQILSGWGGKFHRYLVNGLFRNRAEERRL